MNPLPQSHEFYMTKALQLAEKAFHMGEIPVGAVVVDQTGHMIAQAHNLKESKNLATGHAEILAIEQACAALSSWRLSDCTLYVTLEPCFMCAGAIVHARLKQVVFGTPDPKTGAVESLARVLNDPRLNHNCLVTKGILQEQCSALLKSFFQTRRKSQKPKA